MQQAPTVFQSTRSEKEKKKEARKERRRDGEKGERDGGGWEGSERQRS